MARAPRIHDHAAWRREDEAKQAKIAARFGIAWEDIPSDIASTLLHGEPEHPRQRVGRRLRHHGHSYRQDNVLGWRERLRGYVYGREKFRQAEIAIRKLLTKRTGRGKPLHRKAHVDARYQIEAREWHEEL
jgi:hypothetical protein